MKKIISVCLIAAFFCSCENKKVKETGLEKQFVEVKDSLAESTDSVIEEEVVEVIPENADELFEDFVFHFASDKKLQLLRTVFPLPYLKDGDKSFIQREEWEYDQLFASMDFYAMLFEQEEDMEVEKDTTQNAVTVEYIYTDSCRVKNYNFIRKNGVWKLTNIDEHQLGAHENRDFIQFFHLFVNDSIYQSRHIQDPLKFVTVDPEDDFNILEAIIDIEQWFAFIPPLPKTLLININYGQKYSDKANQKIVALKSISNGFSNVLYFRRIRGEWKLVQFEDVSN